MTDKEKWFKLVSFYENLLNEKFPEFPPERRSERSRISHIKAMFPLMREHLEEDTSKFMRWFGFVQGWLWSQGIFTIEELAAHNKSGV